MHDSKLLQALRLLSARQLSRFGDFLRSPYFNKREDILHFFTYLQKYAPAFSHKNLDKSIVLQKLGFLKKEDTKKLATLMSQLFALFEKFMLIEAMHERPLENWIDLDMQYQRAQLDKHSGMIISKMKKWLAERPHRDGAYFNQQYLIKKHLHAKSDPTKRNYNPQLQAASDALDQMYLVNKLQLALEMENYEQTLDIEYEPQFLAILLEALQGHPYAQIPAIAIYLLLFELLRDIANTATYFELKRQLHDYSTIFSTAELKQIYTTLLNFCTRRITQLHDSAFEQEYFLLNSYLLQEGLLLDEGQLSPWRYSNLVTAALRLGELNWTKNFIEEYKKLLPANYAEDLYQYKMGQYYYHTGELEHAQACLHRVDLKEPLLSLSVKNLLTKIYYETRQTELLLSYLEAYRIALRRDQLIPAHLKKQVRQFINATRKLARLAPFETQKLLALKAALPSGQEMIHKDWIIAMIDKKTTAP